MVNKQTAVDWLVNQIAGKPTHYIIGTDDLEEIKEDRYNLLFNLDIDITALVEKAKQIEKEQIVESHLQGLYSAIKMKGEKQSEEYYQENFGH
jgi:hypothetical protein